LGADPAAPREVSLADIDAMVATLAAGKKLDRPYLSDFVDGRLAAAASVSIGRADSLAK
jgi:hypothetical protein